MYCSTLDAYLLSCSANLRRASRKSPSLQVQCAPGFEVVFTWMTWNAPDGSSPSRSSWCSHQTATYSLSDAKAPAKSVTPTVH